MKTLLATRSIDIPEGGECVLREYGASVENGAAGHHVDAVFSALMVFKDSVSR